MQKIRQSETTKINVVVAILALLAVSLLMLRASSAAFTDTTENENNYFEAASISLVDNDNDEAMFEVEDMVPTQTEERCIQVEYTGSDSADVALFVSAMGNPDGFAQALDVTVEYSESTVAFLGESVNEDFDCDELGFDDTEIDGTYNNDLASFAAAATDFDSGVLTTEFEDGDVVTYRFTVEFEDDVNEIVGVTDLDDLQGAEVEGLTFTWEAQTTVD